MVPYPHAHLQSSKCLPTHHVSLFSFNEDTRLKLYAFYPARLNPSGERKKGLRATCLSLSLFDSSRAASGSWWKLTIIAYRLQYSITATEALLATLPLVFVGHLRKVGGRERARMSSARVSRSQTLTSLFTGRIRLGCSSNTYDSRWVDTRGGGGMLKCCLVSNLF